MKKTIRIPQLYLRLALGFSFLIPVADRFGWLGPAGGKNISWGNWPSFAAYTHLLLPFLNSQLANLMAFLATVSEILIGGFLIVGYKTRAAACGAFLLTLIFALCMALFVGIKAPFNYSVFSASAGSLLLAFMPAYDWSLDNRFKR